MQKGISMIAIIAAMDKEVSAIEQELSKKEAINISNISMIRGELEGRDVIVMKSGVGKGYAAMATAILLERFDIEFIINIGTAGGLNQDQNILDAVVSERVVQHDFDTSPVDGEAGLGLYFDADQALAETCRKVLTRMNIAVHHGLIASGDCFVARDEDVNRIKKYYPNAICAEMEAGAIAQVCAHYKMPFVVLRSLSDITHKADSHMDFIEYVEYAAKRSAEFCREFMKEYTLS